MRYIEKHYDTPTVIQHEQELASVNLDEASLLKREETEKLDGNLLYKEQIRSIFRIGRTYRHKCVKTKVEYVAIVV